MESYNAVAPIYGGAAAAAPAAPADEGPPPTGAAARLAALKSRLSDARSKNHKAVVAEDRRNKLGEDGLKAERREKAWEKKQEEKKLAAAASAAAGGAPAAAADVEAGWNLETTASDAYDKQAKEAKKGKRRGEYGWDVFNNEAQYRHHKKATRRAQADGRTADAGVVDDGADPDPLAYGEAPPVARERVQALVEDMHEAALRRASWSRRRTFHEDRDVTYINKRNEQYNKKIERAFDPYTTEIRANLERGTALQ